MTGGRGGRNEDGDIGGKRDRKDRHTSFLLSENVRDEAYSIYDTLNLCFPDINTNKNKMIKTMTTNNVNCNHNTIIEGVKSWMESVQSTAASTSASASSSLASQHFLVNISGHTLVLQRILYSSGNCDKMITATFILTSSPLRLSQFLLSFPKRCRSKNDSTRPRLRLLLSLVATMELR